MNKKIAMILTAVILVLLGTTIAIKMNASIVKKQGKGVVAEELKEQAIAQTTYTTHRGVTIEAYLVMEDAEKFDLTKEYPFTFAPKDNVLDDELYYGTMKVYLRDREEKKGYVYYEREDAIVSKEKAFDTLKGNEDEMIALFYYDASPPMKEDEDEEEDIEDDLLVRDVKLTYLKVTSESVGFSGRPFTVSSVNWKTDDWGKYQFIHMYEKQDVDEEGEPFGEEKLHVRFVNFDVETKQANSTAGRTKEHFFPEEDLKGPFKKADLETFETAWHQGEMIFGYPEEKLTQEEIERLERDTWEVPYLGERSEDVIAHFHQEGRLIALYEGEDDTQRFITDDGQTYVVEEGVVRHVLYQQMYQYGLPNIEKTLKDIGKKTIKKGTYEFDSYIVTIEDQFIRISAKEVLHS